MTLLFYDFGALDQNQDACLYKRPIWEIWVNHQLHSAPSHYQKKKKKDILCFQFTAITAYFLFYQCISQEK